MTKQDILSMKPGKELDGLIAEHIFGAKWGITPPDIDDNFGGEQILISFFRNYSTNISDAWIVVDKIDTTFLVRKIGNKWIARFYGSPRLEIFIAKANNAPEAICKAALFWKLDWA